MNHREVFEAVRDLKSKVESGYPLINSAKVKAAHALADALATQPQIAECAVRILDDCFPRDRAPNIDMTKLEDIINQLCLGEGRALSWYVGEKLCDDLGM